MKRFVFILLALCAVVVIVWVLTRDTLAPIFTKREIESYAHSLIRVTAPPPHASVSSPLTIVGEARGTWFFEATFPVVIVDWDGRIIGESYATAQGEWMIEDFVPFSATLTFDAPTLYKRGAIILQKSNPSGLPEHDDALELPITFAP